ncbi:MAG: TauD/TfdA family dioxygenase [Pseudomonadota bacterium]|nr:taurine catabolism dioxygenase TauD [Halieaceae bacterium]MEC8003697.1 TauD/TfdA family dioxygenase [Pseudomonadota bacterium]MED5355481.1 TauD/TfdA family dioxygenase [Pseudomonadota bacterium]MED5539808.1 TauD/TfdA family dioxygenase [Pseudomonadota bacterium]
MNVVPICKGSGGQGSGSRTFGSESFGADITGVDLANLTDDTFEAIYRAWLSFGVLRFKGQTLNKDSLQIFSQRFGPLEQIPIGRMSEEQKARLDNLFVTPISNIKVDGKPIGGLGDAEATWHSDMTYVEVPPPASVLLGVEIPQNGGDTFFADQRAALASLPDDLRQRVESLSIKHNAAHDSVGNLRPGFEAFDDPRDAPGAVHPIIRTHNETGDACLYLGRREWAYIPGLSLEESEALLDELWSYAVPADYVVEQNWTPGDVIIWDNRRCLHKRTSIDPSQRRLLLRCQVLARTA